MSCPPELTSSDMPAPRIVELRQYLLQPARRDDLIELFDREFVESQEAVGMDVLGQFRDVDRPDYFVWLRRFKDMESRRESLAAFYGGPVWAQHAKAANSTMIDSDNVLLLRPLSTDVELAVDDAALRDQNSKGGAVVVLIQHREPGREGVQRTLPVRDGTQARVGRCPFDRDLRNRTGQEHLSTPSRSRGQCPRVVRRRCTAVAR